MPFEVGQRATVSGLRSRIDLNGKAALLVCWHRKLQRWEVTIGGEHLRIRPDNLRHDFLLVTTDETVAERFERPSWVNDDPVVAARSLLITKVKESARGFSGRITLYEAGALPREMKFPLVVAVPNDDDLWDEHLLNAAVRTKLTSMAAVRTKLPSTIDVVPDLLDSPVGNEFEYNIALIHRAHTVETTLQIVYRTPHNMQRFLLLQATSLDNAHVSAAILSRSVGGSGTVVCEPTGALVFHRNNVLKLPTTLTIEDAVRKIVELVFDDELTCPICLDDANTEALVFMPCPCLQLIHSNCLKRLYDSDRRDCPVCRAPFSR